MTLLTFMLSKNKFLEVELYNDNKYSWFNISIMLTKRRDHAGFEFVFEILGYGILLLVLDKRHWNNKEDRWYRRGEELAT